ncbi:MAG: rhomboid family intramembrane serine protease [Acidobacteria bacterium]|nr:rhomboid family intramembrane serine protease [Acidobacteriota bacterium]
MIPLWDNVPRKRFPLVTLAVILVNCAVFLREIAVPAEQAGMVIQTFALIPARTAGYLVGEPGSFNTSILTLLTSMFMHGGWMHLIGNMWFLWIYGDNVEDRIGQGRYILLYLAGGLAGGAAHVYFQPDSTVPTLGASGAIAAVMGAYLITFPKAKILTLVPLLIFLVRWELPAYVILIYWLVLQTFSGVASLAAADSSMQGGVAWMAHVGGFLAGIPLMILLRSPRRSSRRAA